jgi:hypothetical protein
MVCQYPKIRSVSSEKDTTAVEVGAQEDRRPIRDYDSHARGKWLSNANGITYGHDPLDYLCDRVKIQHAREIVGT